MNIHFITEDYDGKNASLTNKKKSQIQIMWEKCMDSVGQ